MKAARGAGGSSLGCWRKRAADTRTTTGDWDAAGAPKGKTFIKIKKRGLQEEKKRPCQHRRGGEALWDPGSR